MNLLKTLKHGKSDGKSATAVVPNVTTSPTTTVIVTEEQQAVDSLVALHVHMQENGVFELIKRYEAAKKLCGEFAKMHETDDAIQLVGTEGRVEYSPKTNSTVITDKAAVVELLGQDVFNQLATITITELRKYLNPIQLAKCTEDKKGARSVKAVHPILG